MMKRTCCCCIRCFLRLILSLGLLDKGELLPWLLAFLGNIAVFMTENFSRAARVKWILMYEDVDRVLTGSTSQ